MPELIRAVMLLCKTVPGSGGYLALSPILLTDFTVETLSPFRETARRPREASTRILTTNWVFIYDFEQAARHIREFLDGPLTAFPLKAAGYRKGC